jgi:hypothetical protein
MQYAFSLLMIVWATLAQAVRYYTDAAGHQVRAYANTEQVYSSDGRTHLYTRTYDGRITWAADIRALSRVSDTPQTQNDYIPPCEAELERIESAEAALEARARGECIHGRKLGSCFLCPGQGHRCRYYCPAHDGSCLHCRGQ